MRCYYWRWITTAFHHSLGWAEKIAGFIGLWIAPAINFMFDLDVGTGILAWLMLGTVAIAIVVARLALAPYWMHLEDASRGARIQQERDHVKSQLESLDSTSRLDEAHERLGHIRAALLQQADEAQKTDGMLYKPGMSSAWIDATRQMLSDTLKPEVRNRFRVYGNSPPMFERTVTSLRTLASDLKVDDLRR